MGTSCPNCGHSLTSYRKDRQAVGSRRFVLERSICRRCNHIALNRWYLDEEERRQSGMTAERRGNDRAQTGRRVRASPIF